MINQDTKILTVTNVYEEIWTDYSSTLLTEYNTTEVEFNSGLDLYIGNPNPFYLTYFWLASYTSTLSGLSIKYYKTGTPPTWTTIATTAITDTTSSLNNTGRISWLSSNTSGWIPSTVWAFSNYYWIKINTVDTGSCNLLNVFNYITTTENIINDKLAQLRVVPFYCVVFRPNKPIIGD